MSKKCYRFFGGLLNAQAKWLNKMSEKGYRLVRTGRVLYAFEECSPDDVTYCVEFIGEKSKENATAVSYTHLDVYKRQDPAHALQHGVHRAVVREQREEQHCKGGGHDQRCV